MHGPNLATLIKPASRRDFYAGVCRSGCQANAGLGWFVPYRRVRGYFKAYEAIINLHVQDLQSTFVAILPFVIDTGTDVTIIPRRLLSPSAFPRSKSLGPYDVTGLTGKTVVGLRFRAAVSVAQLQRSSDLLGFGKLTPIVVRDKDWEGDYGMLGLDALRKVVMVSDGDCVSLWPKPRGPCLAA